MSRRPHSTYCSFCVQELNQSPQDVPLLLFLTSQVRSRGQVCFFNDRVKRALQQWPSRNGTEASVMGFSPLNLTWTNLWDSEVTKIRIQMKERLICKLSIPIGRTCNLWGDSAGHCHAAHYTASLSRIVWRIRKYSATHYMTRVAFWDAPLESM